FELKGDEAGVDPRYLEQVVDEAAEVGDLLLNSVVVALDGGGVGHHTVVDALHHRLDRSQRATEVVRDGRDEVATPGFEVLLALEGGFELGGHAVEGGGDLFQLVASTHLEPGVKLAGAHAIHGIKHD